MCVCVTSVTIVTKAKRWRLTFECLQTTCLHQYNYKIIFQCCKFEKRIAKLYYNTPTLQHCLKEEWLCTGAAGHCTRLDSKKLLCVWQRLSWASHESPKLLNITYTSKPTRYTKLLLYIIYYYSITSKIITATICQNRSDILQFYLHFYYLLISVLY
jgi:hypothetical protein